MLAKPCVACMFVVHTSRDEPVGKPTSKDCRQAHAHPWKHIVEPCLVLMVRKHIVKEGRDPNHHTMQEKTLAEVTIEHGPAERGEEKCGKERGKEGMRERSEGEREERGMEKQIHINRCYCHFNYCRSRTAYVGHCQDK